MYAKADTSTKKREEAASNYLKGAIIMTVIAVSIIVCFVFFFAISKSY